MTLPLPSLGFEVRLSFDVSAEVSLPRGPSPSVVADVEYESWADELRL